MISSWEFLTTFVALEKFFSCVNLWMPFQGAWLCTNVLAHFTHEPLLLSVNFFVFFQHGQSRATVFASVAVSWNSFRQIVSFSVSLEVACIGTSVVTLITFVRFFTAVRSHVLLQVTRPRTWIFALITLVWFFTIVGLHVHTSEKQKSFLSSHYQIFGKLRKSSTETETCVEKRWDDHVFIPWCNTLNRGRGMGASVEKQ